MSDILKCISCSRILPDIEYYECSNQHNICGYCFANTRHKCPECKEAYGVPPSRNHTLEKLVANDPKLAVACKNVIGGCEYSGPKKERLVHEQRECKLMIAHCPVIQCGFIVPLEQLKSHVQSAHKEGRIVSNSDGTHETKFPFNPEWLSSGSVWPIKKIRHDGHSFYVCGLFEKGSDCLTYYLTLEGTEKAAERYNCELTLWGDNATKLTWAGPVFSATMPKKSIWKHKACLNVSKQLITRMTTERGVTEASRGNGVTHYIHSQIKISSSQGIFSYMLSKLNPWNWLG